ncbi:MULTISPECIES: hypothetical protein [Bacteria]|uniref:hypothetical protein n=1 Tax=Bacteria TaxID=2 RepID=UPI003C79E4C1
MTLTKPTHTPGGDMGNPRSLNVRRGDIFHGADGSLWRAANGYTLYEIDRHGGRMPRTSPLTVAFVQERYGPLTPVG